MYLYVFYATFSVGINMAFTAYLLEIASFGVVPGWGIYTFFKPYRGGFCVNPPALPWGICIFSRKKKEKEREIPGGWVLWN